MKVSAFHSTSSADPARHGSVAKTGGSAFLEKITAAAFDQHRKMLRQRMKAMPGAQDALQALNIDSERRAETLEVAISWHWRATYRHPVPEPGTTFVCIVDSELP